MFYIRSKNIFLHQNYLGALKLSKQKSFENFPIFILYSVQGAWCGGRRKFLADRRIFKHC
jgi:hypothetical protein